MRLLTSIVLALVLTSSMALAAGELKGKKAPDTAFKVFGEEETISFPVEGAKVTIVDFWASWCKPCLAQHEELKKLHEKYKDKGLAIVAVNFDESEKTITRFQKKKSLPFTIAMGDVETIDSFAKVQSIPHMFIIDAEGTVKVDHVGLMMLADLEKKIAPMLGEANEEPDSKNTMSSEDKDDDA